MFLPIYLYGHPVLKNISQEITMDYPDLDKLIEDMFYTMDYADGVGLAAPQIGKNIRLFVIDTTAFTEHDPECNGYRKAFINANIVERFGDMIDREEGCLSVPGIHEYVRRHESIRMQYMDEKGEQHEEVFSGFKAWVIQHEYDHLEGMVFTDHISALKRRLIKSKLTNIATGKSSCRYKCVRGIK
ncbi:MAG: peptide deformylase [Marinifilaceae bacterium]|nr:peptide deformylase [Marinifilaceae bacterium]